MASQREFEASLAPGFPLSVILVEDNSDDARLCSRVLQKAHFELQFDVVATADELVARLRSKTYDVVLTDYNLGCWTGMDVLDLLRRERCDVPVILVTGALGEQRAVECLKAGISDYILKDRMERLPLAVNKVLEEKALRCEQRRLDDLLRSSEKKFRALADAIPLAVFIEQGTQCCYANLAAESITGYSNGELLAANFWELLLPDSRKALIGCATANRDSDEALPTQCQARIYTKSGEIRLLDVTVGTFQIEGGLAALITAVDVTGSNGVRERSLDPIPAGRPATTVNRPRTPNWRDAAMNQLCAVAGR